MLQSHIKIEKAQQKALSSFIQTLTVGPGIAPSQPTHGVSRVADFTAGSDLHRPPEQRGVSLPHPLLVRATKRPWQQDRRP